MKAIVTVNGVDRVGIIAAVSAKLAGLNINIDDIKQTTLQDQFNMIMMVDISNCEISFMDIIKELNLLSEEIGMDIRMRRKDIFDAMQNI
ncbi:MAG: ACT domain-containing protein [Christensenellales bacterium]|jgi:ACT domain-containing protein